MDDLTAFISARLDDWQRLAQQALPLQTGSRDEGQPVEHVSWRRSAGHPEFALQHVTTLRAIVAIAEADTKARAEQDAPDGPLLVVLRCIASDFSTHPDYQAGWAP